MGIKERQNKGGDGMSTIIWFIIAVDLYLLHRLGLILSWWGGDESGPRDL